MGKNSVKSKENVCCDESNLNYVMVHFHQVQYYLSNVNVMFSWLRIRVNF